ncbi:MAG: hypothetical protein ACREQ5_06920, partial [Candidatus Dormibacteria bacterium]
MTATHPNPPPSDTDDVEQQGRPHTVALLLHNRTTKTLNHPVSYPESTGTTVRIQPERLSGIAGMHKWAFSRNEKALRRATS